jgi:uncharacterized C2H2 Zn-finger protein
MEKQIIDITENNEFTDCPKCEANLRGKSVSRTDKPYFGQFGHYSRVEVASRDPDGLVLAWKCPSCGHITERFK